MSDQTRPPTLFEPAARGAIRIDGDRDLAALIALAGLPNLTPKRLWSLISTDSPAQAWGRVVAGRAPRFGHARDAAASWRDWAEAIEPRRLLDHHRKLGVAIHPFGSTSYPSAFLDDPEPPAVVFGVGPGWPDGRPAVGIVGTRRCTPYGRDVARELGGALAGRGARVVSGLASGIDAAAHAGSCAAEPSAGIAVVAGGVDVIYPRSNRELFRQVAERGVIMSEWPLGARPLRWRFPARNRLIAALSQAVVVVESAVRGGSMYTVDEALRRDRAVFAVPGSIRSPVSAGTNRLIADGAGPLYGFDELFDLLDLGPPEPGDTVRPRAAPKSWLLDLVGWEPIGLDDVLAHARRPALEVTLEVERMIACGALRRLGATIERVR